MVVQDDDEEPDYGDDQLEAYADDPEIQKILE